MLYGTPSHAQPLAIRHMLAQEARACLFVTHHDRQLQQFMDTAPFFLPDIPILAFPAWDTLPYDRSAPSRSIMAQRVAVLTQLLELRRSKRPYVVATTVNALLQRLPPTATFQDARLEIKAGGALDQTRLSAYLTRQGYRRASKVMEPGEFAIRGSIIDVFPGHAERPLRLDMFDDVVESMKAFDPLTQRSGEAQASLTMNPTAEVTLSEAHVTRFRQRYRELFGHPHREDALYHTVSEGQYYAGMEHWLPLFYERMESLFDYLPEAHVCLDHDVPATLRERVALIEDYYQARHEQETVAAKERTAPIYHPVPPEQAYLMDAWEKEIGKRQACVLSPFDAPDGADTLSMKPSPKLSAMAKNNKVSPFQALADQVSRESRPVMIAAHSRGSAERLTQQITAQHLPTPAPITNWQAMQTAKPGLYLATLPVPSGFQSDRFVLYSEEDVLGRRIMRTRKKRQSSDAFMAEASAFDVDELLVHKDHGIGCFKGLETLEVNGRQHDCLKLHYKDDDRLFVPVENMELIMRHGGEAGDTELDKLGAGSWQARKAAYKEKLRLTAEALLKTAAARELAQASALSSPEDIYGDFAERFPYEETDDQQRAIDEVIEDLGRSRPMDRLLCGDVGFGKTEVALRAAFVAATDVMKPVQVAFIAPTTLLVRQHYHNFRERFQETGLEVAQLSRLCSAKEVKRVKEGLADGSIDIVIGTHALLAESIQFQNLGLLIVDEEQRFGVKQKEKLKNLKSDLHVLSMSATPIPRTLQMSLTGVRDLSLITTPPVDRLAIRSFVMPFDPVVIKEAITRELHRGGQVFYVTPRIAELAELKVRILDMVPDIRLAIAHGQMSPGELDSVMNDVYDGKYDVLLSTAIIESGIDIPSANTMIINRADRFGLAQLYQLRGRVGRGKVRAYAYFTLPYHGAMTAQAVKRLEVMQSLDTLGAGFTLASHDMDIRGFGNLVGEEQSGHVKDVGVELYQQMLADAVRQARQSDKESAPIADDEWSPQLNLGLSVLIPEAYVEDLSLRLSLYRRAATLETPEEIEGFAAELADRFGTIPEEAEHLFTTLKLKQACRAAGIARIDTGPKGAVIHFHETAIRDPQALIGYIARHSDVMKLRADQSLFYRAEWHSDGQKLTDIRQLIEGLGAL